MSDPRRQPRRDSTNDRSADARGHNRAAPRTGGKRTPDRQPRAEAPSGHGNRAHGRDQRDNIEQRRSKYPTVHLSDDVVEELHATARPGKGPILVQVFSEAASAFAAEDYDEASRLGDQAKHIALRSAAVRELLGLTRYRSGRWKDASRELAAFRRLTGSAEQNPVLADCYRALGRPERAVELCDEIDEGTVPAAVAFEGAIVASGALRDMGRIGDAVTRLEALELHPDEAREHHLRAWYALGDLLEQRGRFTQARGWFEAVAHADPELSDAPLRAARLSGEAPT